MQTPGEIAQELDALRRASGKSYRQLALETGLGFNTIAGYCAGRHLPQLSVHREFQQLLTALGVTEPHAQQAWFDALAALRAPSGRNLPPTRNPFRGLRAFQADEAGDFFGRNELTARLVACVAAHQPGGTPLIVVGPSGAGKSSLLQAGLIAAVPASVLMTPGTRPLRRWADHAAAVDGDTLVVIDQFEELFTLCTDASERDGFLTGLLNHRGPVVIGLRADFYERALGHPQLADLLQRRQVLVTPMTEAQLTEAIVAPARSAGLALESGLVELLLRDTAREPGVLPLLSHTLHTIVELALHSDTPTATVGVAHYRTAGGLDGAIAKSADLAYQSLTPAQRRATRYLFLRLVRSGDGAVTRRPVSFEELLDERPVEQTDHMAEALDVFITHRLLTANTQTVEIAHEALVAHWPQLLAWLAEDRAGHHIHGKLTAGARTWRDDGRPPEGLYRGGALATALEWADETGPDDVLNPLEREFLTASAAARTALSAAQRRRVRRRYQLMSTLLVLILTAVGASLYARGVSASAAYQARMDLSRQTAGTADRLRPKDPALAAQLALTAYRIAQTPEAREALLDSSATPMPRRTVTPGSPATTIAATGTLLATGTADGAVQLWRTASDADPIHIGAVPTTSRPVALLALSRDGRQLAIAGADGTVTAWQTTDPAHPVALPLQPIPAEGARSPAVHGLAFSPDGAYLAAGISSSTGGGTVYLWRLNGKSPPTALDGPRRAVKSVVFSPDGHLLAAGGGDGTVHLWSLSIPDRPRPMPALTGPVSEIYTIAISPDSRTLAAGTAAEHAVYTWNITDPAHPRTLGTPLTGPDSWINTVAFSPDGTTLAAGSSDTFTWQWDLRTRQVTASLPQPDPVTAAVFGGSNSLNTLATDGVVRTWTLPGPILTRTDKQIYSVSFDATGTRLLAGTGDGRLHLWQLTDPAHPLLLTAPLGNDGSAAPLAGASALTPDGATAIGGATDGSIRLWNVADPSKPRSLGLPLPVARLTIEAIAVSHDGSTAAVSSDDGSVHLIDIADPAQPVVMATLTGPVGIAFGVRFSPDGHLLAVTGQNATGYLWDLRDHTHPHLLTTVTGFNGAVYAVAFSPDNRLVAFGAADYSVRLVDLTRPQAPAVLPTPLIGPVGEIYELTFTPDSDVLAVSSVDSTIWLWDLNQPRKPALLSTLQAGTGGLFTVAFAPDGHTLAAGGANRTLQLWNTDPDSVAAWICRNAGAPITPSQWGQFIPGQPYDPPCRH